MSAKIVVVLLLSICFGICLGGSIMIPITVKRLGLKNLVMREICAVVITVVTAVSLFSSQWSSLAKFPGWALLGMLGAMLVGIVLAVIMMLMFMKINLRE